MPVPEAKLEQTEHGLVPKGHGWFVVNARETRWLARDGRGHIVPLTGWEDEDVVANFAQLGINVDVLRPGETMAMYHREADQEDFLVVVGEALLLVEGEERPLKQWDFVHTPPGASHTILGAGTAPCVVVAIGSRAHQAGDDWGAYTVDETAIRHGVGVEEETNDPEIAYARFRASEPTRYRDGLLPDSTASRSAR